MSLDVGVCFSTGYNFALAKNKEDEVKQGKSYYHASLCQISQIYNLSSIAEILADKIPNDALRVTAQVSNQAVPIFSTALFPFFALVKQGHYEMGVKVLKDLTKSSRFSGISNLFPDQLNEKTIRICSFLAEHAGDMITVGMITTTAALPIIASKYCCGAVIAPVMYQAIDSRGWIPRKISLFVESYMPVVTNLTFLSGGSLLNKTVSALSLAYYFPPVVKTIHQKFDKLNQSFCAPSFTLEEMEGSLVEKRNLSFDEIVRILSADHDEFELNPAHLSKAIAGFISFKENRDFDDFMELFKSINWCHKYNLIKHRFKDDDRFQDYLRAEFPNKNDLTTNFESYIEQLAKIHSQPKEGLLAKLLKSQMEEFIKVLKGEKRVKGSQADLNEAINNCSKILKYLQTLKMNKPADRLELEDILLKLSMEGGDYCARALKRASQEIIKEITQKCIKANKQTYEPLKSYEFGIQLSLLELRNKIVDWMYQKYLEINVRLVKEGVNARIALNEDTTDTQAVSMAQDIHMLDNFRKYFSLGFVPMTNGERTSFGLLDIFMWGSPLYPYREMRGYMLARYFNEMNEVFRENGEIHFGNYIRGILLENKKLTKDQADSIIDKLANCNDWKWNFNETNEKFHRLMLVTLGVLRQKTISADWQEVQKVDFSLAVAKKKKPKKDPDSDWVNIQLDDLIH